MKKVRIIKRTTPDSRIQYIIQQKHFLFKWWWVDAWINYDASTIDSFNTLEEAKKNLKYFDGTQCKEEVVFK